MIKILDRVAVIIFGLLSVVFTIGFFELNIMKNIINMPNFIFIGIVCFLICNQITTPFIAVNLKRYKVSVHESIHIMVALLFGKQIIESRTSHNNGGYIKHQGGLNFSGVGLLISLAPYFVSYLVWIFIGLKFIIVASLSNYVFFCIGFVWAFHLLTFYEQLIGYYFRNGLHQPDIVGSKYYSKYSAYIFIFLMNVLINSIIILILAGNESFVDEFVLYPLQLLW
ncbi:MAG: hypothetical protein P1U56_18515 [Saprospiraceae bacterium]|nr:hypothetical protein [Saprospiraceae bacterium]